VARTADGREWGRCTSCRRLSPVGPCVDCKTGEAVSLKEFWAAELERALMRDHDALDRALGDVEMMKKLRVVHPQPVGARCTAIAHENGFTSTNLNANKEKRRCGECGALLTVEDHGDGRWDPGLPKGR